MEDYTKKILWKMVDILVILLALYIINHLATNFFEHITKESNERIQRIQEEQKIKNEKARQERMAAQAAREAEREWERQQREWERQKRAAEFEEKRRQQQVDRQVKANSQNILCWIDEKGQKTYSNSVPPGKGVKPCP